MTLVRIGIWVVVAAIVSSWALLMAWIINDVHDLMADPPSDQRDADL
jgi:hypothetical protein